METIFNASISKSQFRGKKIDILKSGSLEEFDRKGILSYLNKNKYNFTEFMLVNDRYIFFENDLKMGILTKPIIAVSDFLIDDHKKIIKNMGSIIELFNFPDDKIINNLIEVFPNDIDSKGLGLYEKDYILKCGKSYDISNDLLNLYTFAYEANGNRFLYDKEGRIFVYASDHYLDNLIPLTNCPEDTFYKIQNIPTFSDFVLHFFNIF